MNNNQKRILFSFVIAIIVLTAFFLLLKRTPLVIAAYCCSLLAPIALLANLWLVAPELKNKFITGAALSMQTLFYCIQNLIVCGVFILLDQTTVWSIPVVWFVCLHIVLLAVFLWKIIAMSSAKEEIERVEQNVRMKTVDWKMLQANVESLRNDAPELCRKDIQSVAEAIRYADPMDCRELNSLKESIKDNILQLELNLRESNTKNIPLVCMKIQQQIKEYNTKAKILK